ncbi:putative transposase/invertase (TIGR01784 family) [Clostridium punense]|uniref:Transposase/invertase (TIGR01784 family) n=1 Tax=Clostridium punense TaxID=1054297 RepID=A0ABS4K5D2_9CLOT|nr:Rpn family recombination-promoting nuclease/putative transposase [Clostridium punense]MBP2022985.1 putative transposase/invertase (TIGR01784 family) [Clostridium punense]
MQYNSIMEGYFIKEDSNKYEDFLLKPKNDFVFKKIFGDVKNKDLLISLLNSILSDKVNDVTILNSELPKENIEDKKSVLDVRAVTDAGYHIDIEIQVLRTVSMPERSLYYWSKLYIEQIAVGESYKKLKKTIAINIVDYDCINTNKYHNIFHIMEDETKLKLTEVLEIHFIELRKLKNINTIDKLSQWMNFIKGDSKEVILEMAKVNSDIEKAYDILRTMSQDRETRALYLSREMALHDEATRREEALEEGVEIGRTTLLIKLLKKRFKDFSKDMEEKIKKLPEDKFEVLSLDIFELKTIEDIYKYI